ncbi:MAG: chromosome partitioning protein ParB [Opitutus sp.]
MPIQTLSLESINLYGGTQARVTTSDEAVSSYADEMSQGAVFPPIIVFFDGATYWLADGFHRYLAVKRNGGTTISAEVETGGRLDALRHALGANATNGVYRNNADKRNAVEVALEEWSDHANPVLADICKVSVDFVRRTRTQLTESGRLQPAERVTGRDGKEYPAKIQRQPRGKTEGSSSESSGGGGGGRGARGKGGMGNLGGSNLELEREAREMVRKGELNPFELPTIFSANALDYAETVINLLKTMKADDPLRPDGLLRIKHWVEKALAVETVSAEEAAEIASS